MKIPPLEVPCPSCKETISVPLTVRLDSERNSEGVATATLTTSPPKCDHCGWLI